MRQILSGEQLIHTYTASGPGGYSPRVSSLLPPRISLRCWAQHRTIVLLIAGYAFCFFLGYPVLLVVLLACFTWFLVLLFRYWIGWAPTPIRHSSHNSSFWNIFILTNFCVMIKNSFIYIFLLFAYNVFCLKHLKYNYFIYCHDLLVFLIKIVLLLPFFSYFML